MLIPESATIPISLRSWLMRDESIYLYAHRIPTDPPTAWLWTLIAQLIVQHLPDHLPTLPPADAPYPTVWKTWVALLNRLASTTKPITIVLEGMDHWERPWEQLPVVLPAGVVIIMPIPLAPNAMPEWPVNMVIMPIPSDPIPTAIRDGIDHLEAHARTDPSQWKTILCPLLACLHGAYAPLTVTAIATIFAVPVETVEAAVAWIPSILAVTLDGVLCLMPGLAEIPAWNRLFPASVLGDGHRRLAAWCGQAEAVIGQDTVDDAAFEQRRYASHAFLMHLTGAQQERQIGLLLDAGVYGLAKIQGDGTRDGVIADLMYGVVLQTPSPSIPLDVVLVRAWQYRLLALRLQTAVEETNHDRWRGMVELGFGTEAMHQIAQLPHQSERIAAWSAVLAVGNTVQRQAIYAQIVAAIPHGPIDPTVLRSILTSAMEHGDWAILEPLVSAYPNAWQRGMMMLTIAQAAARADQHRIARQWLLRVQTAIPLDLLPVQQLAMVGLVAETAVVIGDRETARQIADRMDDQRFRSHIQRRIIDAAIAAGAIAEAQTIVQTIPNPASRAAGLQALAVDAARRGAWDTAHQSVAAIVDHPIADATRDALVQAAIDQGRLDDAALLAQSIDEAPSKVHALTALGTAYAQRGDWMQADTILRILDTTDGDQESALLAMVVAAATTDNGAKVHALLPLISHVPGLYQAIVAAHEQGHHALRDQVIQYMLQYAQTFIDDQEQASFLHNTLFLLVHVRVYRFMPPFLAAIRDPHARAWMGTDLTMRAMGVPAPPLRQGRGSIDGMDDTMALVNPILAAWIDAPTPSALWARLSMVHPLLAAYPDLGAALLATIPWVDAMVARLTRYG
ncbi:hypothetical protein Haur_5295 (plasmid) [Herpetosiphon aurantiacus DSM 785]|uniref:Uncharacterized protein n=1 Tax=Herpetosiphon aurantiacus (strain ATCC 23779 / DSM 785 / 114-95) TaxID=316274 RepID=A9B9A8_HERA2|nr:hypothetical protein Haur_5295 [Herpetosiphon aurantiacus DSM 785]